MNTIIIYLLFIALAFRMLLLILKRREPILSDAQDYHSLALHLMEGKYKVPGTKLDEFRTPGYPFFVSLIYRVAGHGQLSIYLVHILLNIGSIYMTYLIGNLLFGQVAGMLAAGVLILEPDFLYYIFDLLTETIYTFLLLVSIYLMLLFDQSGSVIYPILTGLTLSAMTYVKPGSFLLPVVYCFFLPFGQITWFAGFYLAPLIPWMMRNYLKHGNFRMCSIAGYNLLVFNVGENKNNPELSRYIRAIKFIRVIEGFEYTRYHSQVARAEIGAFPGRFIINQLRGIYRMFAGLTLHLFAARFMGVKLISEIPLTPTPQNLKNIFKTTLAVQLIYIVCIYTAATIGIFKAGSEGLLLTGIILYLAILPGGAGSARYRVPIMPLIILFAIKFLI